MRLYSGSSGECLKFGFKFVQVALLYKLDIIYLKSISREYAIHLLTKSHLNTWIKKADKRILDYCLRKLSSVFKRNRWEVFSFCIQKLSWFFYLSVAKSISMFTLCGYIKVVVVKIINIPIIYHFSVFIFLLWLCNLRLSIDGKTC